MTTIDRKTANAAHIVEQGREWGPRGFRRRSVRPTEEHARDNRPWEDDQAEPCCGFLVCYCPSEPIEEPRPVAPESLAGDGGWRVGDRVRYGIDVLTVVEVDGGRVRWCDGVWSRPVSAEDWQDTVGSEERLPRTPESVIDWRRRAESEAHDAEHLRACVKAAEASLLELLALITMTGELTWHVDLPSTDPVGGAVERAGVVLDGLRAALGMEG